MHLQNTDCKRLITLSTSPFIKQTAGFQITPCLCKCIGLKHLFVCLCLPVCLCACLLNILFVKLYSLYSNALLMHIYAMHYAKLNPINPNPNNERRGRLKKVTFHEASYWLSYIFLIHYQEAMVFGQS